MLVVGFLIGVVVLSVAFVHYDKLVKFQYSKYREQWEQYGRPSGFFWNPPESPFLSGSVQRTMRVLSWSFVTEDWMRNEVTLLRSVWVMRTSLLVFLVIWALVVITAFK